MIFSKKKKKPNKKMLQRLKNRRLQIIMEARRIHDKALKKIRGKDKDEGVSMGYTNVKSMEEEDIAFALGQATTRALEAGGRGIAKLKSRARKLKKSKSSHMKRLQKARKTMKSRSRG